MTMPTPSDQELHAYADGQLDADRRREVERYLADHPDAAREVDAIRQHTDGLRRQHADLGRFVAPPRLDPAQIIVGKAASHGETSLSRVQGCRKTTDGRVYSRPWREYYIWTVRAGIPARSPRWGTVQ